MLENDRNAIAIVGTRQPSFYGRMQAKRFAQELATRELTIVSELARGIDQVGHDAALQVAYGNLSKKALVFWKRLKMFCSSWRIG